MTLNFAALDVETANPTRASICSFGVAIVRDGQVTEKHHLLTMPPAGLNTFSPIHTAIHGLTAADVAGEPAFDVRLKEVLLLIGDLPVVAHNASFDFGAIRDACEVALIPIPALTYGCTLAMSRHADLSLSKYSLPAVCEALGIDQGHHHRADDDAEAAARIMLALLSLRGIETLAELSVALNVNFLSLNEPDGSRLSGVSATSGYWTDRSARAAAHPKAPPANAAADPAHPLYGQHIVFTGEFNEHRGVFNEAAAQCGATVQGGVTIKATTILVIGGGYTGTITHAFDSEAVRKAVRINLKGGTIRILTEKDFLALVAQP